MGFRLCLGASVVSGFAFTHRLAFTAKTGVADDSSHEATGAGIGIVVVSIGW
jgi:hypothetical protein